MTGIHNEKNDNKTTESIPASGFDRYTVVIRGDNGKIGQYASVV
jgi:hypothetical protein